MAQPTQPDRSADRQLVTGSALIKRLRKLVTQRKARSRERAFVVDGVKLVGEALGTESSTTDVQAVIVGADAPDAVAAIEPVAAARGLAVHVAVGGLLESILDPVTPQPVAAIVTRRRDSLTDLGRGVPVLCLVEARDPGNVGTLVRSAEAAGAGGVLLLGSCVDPTNPKAVRASAGSILRTPVVELPDVEGAIADLRTTGRLIIATVAEREAIPYDEVRLADAAILLGNEAHGLADEVIARADVAATIPLAGRTESLNVAVAGSLFCFEARRQSRQASSSVPNSLDT